MIDVVDVTWYKNISLEFVHRDVKNYWILHASLCNSASVTTLMKIVRPSGTYCDVSQIQSRKVATATVTLSELG